MGIPAAGAPAPPGYTLGRLLGRGGQAEVVAAEHATLGAVVLKRYPGDAASRACAAAELALHRRLSHPHLAELVDHGEAAEGPWLAFARIDGLSLADAIDSCGGLDAEDALRCMRQVALALDALDRLAGCAHRDIKPGNILLSPSGRAVLIDLALAVPFGAAAGVQGTRAYMAPEQLAGAPSDRRSDIYALGASIAHALAGRRLTAPESPGMERIPEDLRGFLSACLAADPARRPSSASAVADACERLLTARQAPLAAPLSMQMRTGSDLHPRLLGQPARAADLHPHSDSRRMPALEPRPGAAPRPRRMRIGWGWFALLWLLLLGGAAAAALLLRP